MEVFRVDSVRELRQLRQLFHGIPVFVFTGGYLNVRIDVEGYDCLAHAPNASRILEDLIAVYYCEVSNMEQANDVAHYADALLVLKSLAEDAEHDAQYSELGTFLRLGHAAQLAWELGTDLGVDGGAMDLLFDLTKEAVSCANTGQDLLYRNINNHYRWGTLVRRLYVLQADIDRLLGSPVFLL